MIRALVLLSIGFWVVSSVVAEESLNPFRKDLVIMEISSEKIPTFTEAPMEESLADDGIMEPSTEGAIHASRENHTYYLPSCEGYQQVNSAELVPFASEEIATESGYQRAESCS